LDSFALLTSTVEESEASIIEALLKDNGISIIKQKRDTGGYMGVVYGNTFLGVDIYVSPEDLKTAKEILKSENLLSDEIKEESIPENTTEMTLMVKLGAITKNCIRLILIIGAIYFLYGMISSLRH
jgi:hypothetical protein